MAENDNPELTEGTGAAPSNADKLNLTMVAAATLTRRGDVSEEMKALGSFEVWCTDADGNEKWREAFPNVVATIGKNLMLDTALAGAAYTVVGPFMGLISSVSFTAVAAGDTMTSHSGWLEAGGTNAPTYTAPRKTCAWSAASGGSKALSAALPFAITGTGTIKGVFILYGTGALSTIDNTAGTLLSAGLFTGGDRAVLSGDTVNASYSLAL